MFKRASTAMLVGLILLGSIFGCESPVANTVGVSSGGLIVGLKALSGNSGLPADGISQATIRVEVFNTAGQVVDGAEIFMTTTLGTIEQQLDDNGDFTTESGVALATLTSGTEPGTAFVVATVENVTATVAVQIVNITGTVA